MSGEVEQQGQEPIQSEDNDADFAAGLKGDAPTETPAATPEPSPAPSPEPTPEPTPAPAEAPKYVQISEDEWNTTKANAAKVEEITATLAKVRDNAFGEIGGLKRIVTELQAKTPKGEAVEIADDDFAEMKEQYPELAEVQIKGLNKALSRFKGTADPEAIEKLVAPRMQKVREEMLEVAFPGWQNDVKTPDFTQWLQSQGAETQALAASDLLPEASKLLKLYYEKAKSASTATPPAPQPPKPVVVPTRARQIAAAVPPRGDGGHRPAAGNDEDEAFMAGLKGG